MRIDGTEIDCLQWKPFIYWRLCLFIMERKSPLTWRKTQLECYDFGHNFGTFFKNGDIKEIYIFSLKLEETEDKYDLTATAEYR